MFTIIILIVSFGVLKYLYDRITSLFSKNKHLPGPKGYPIIGNLHILAYIGLKGQEPFDALKDMNDKYGPICGWKFGFNNFVGVGELDIAKKMLNSEVFSARVPEKSIRFEYYFNQNLGLFFSWGREWKDTRNYVLKHLFREYATKGGESFEKLVCEETSEFMAVFDTLLKCNSNIVNIKNLFILSSVNTIWSMVAGERFSYDDQRLNQLIVLLKAATKAEKPGVDLVYIFPFLRYIPGLTSHQILSEYHKSFQCFFKEILHGRKKNYKLNPDQEPENFLDKLVQDIEKKVPNFNDEKFIMLCLDIFFGGSDSSSTTLEWAFLFLILNDRVYKKVQAEIDSVIGNEAPNLEHKPKMPYFEAFMYETLRVGNVIPINGRAPNRDSYFEGYFIPKDTFIGINSYAIHHSKKIWEDPEEFRPERFLDDEMKIINADKIIPFGYGKRTCVGEHFSKKFVFIFMTSLLQKYSFIKSPINPEPSMSFCCGLTRSPNAVNVQVLLRNQLN